MYISVKRATHFAVQTQFSMNSSKTFKTRKKKAIQKVPLFVLCL